MMKLQRFKATARLSILLLSLAPYGFSAERKATVSEKEKRAASVLFEHFETVFRTDPALLTEPQLSDPYGFMAEPFGYVVYGLDHKSPAAKEPAAGAILLDNSEAMLLGTRDYAPPDGLGRVVSTRCYIAILRDGRGSGFTRYLGNPTQKSLSGHPIWTWSVNLGEFGDRKTRMSSLYATQVGGAYFVVTNSLSELQNIAKELSTTTRSSVTLSRLRDWESVEEQQFWSYRRYKNARSRPAATMFNGLEGVRPEAEGLILFVDLKQQRGILRFLIANPDDTTASSLSEKWALPAFKSIGNGEWEMVFPLSEKDPLETSFKVWWLFGWGLVI